MLKKGFLTFVIIGFCFMFLSERTLAAETEGQKEKHIHIVLDNSGSMVENRSTDLADATYALQVLLGMMGDADTAVIYPVSEYQAEWANEEISEQCSQDSKNIKVTNAVTETQIESMFTDSGLAGRTYFNTVMYALKELENDKTEAEKWLVVLTDGVYEDWPKDTLENGKVITKVHGLLSDEQYDDINIIHYSFKETRYSDNTGEKSNITYYPETQYESMLDVMLDIGNQIFARQVVKTISEDGTYDIELNAPAGRVIVLAQNEYSEGNQNIQIKLNNTETGNKKKVAKIENMELGAQYEYTVGTVYSGIIAVYEDFNGQAGLLSAGTHSLEISGLGKNGTAEVYFEPEMELGLVFENLESGEEYIHGGQDSFSIPSGEYTVYTRLYDPLLSDFENGIYTELEWQMHSVGETQVKLNGTDVVGQWESGTDIWTGTLTPGTYTASKIVNIFEGLDKRVDLNIKVIDSLKNMNVELIVPYGGINIEALGTEGNCLEIKIDNNGEALTQEQKDGVTIELVSENESYRYRVEETEDGWLLWPERKQYILRYTDEIWGERTETFQVSMKVGDVEMVPIEVSAKVNYYGGDFSIGIKTNWGEDIGILEFFLTPLKIEPVIDGESVDWSIAEIKEISPVAWNQNEAVYAVQLSENRHSWEVSREKKLSDLIDFVELRNGEQEILVNLTLERYGREESIQKTVKIVTNISLLDITIVYATGAILLYMLFVFVYKSLRQICMGGLKGYIEYCKDPINNLPVKVRMCQFYNLFVPTKSKFEVYLNEITNGDGHKIVFKCRARGVCTVENLKGCQSFSQIRINGFLVKENSMYDLDHRLVIVVEKDPEKPIVVFRG